jgi:transcriptional regulator with XRE-family HTH domain
MDIASRIRFYRRSRGLSQRGLGLKLGMASSQLSRYESGRVEPTLSVLRRIAGVLNVPVSDFLSGR